MSRWNLLLEEAKKCNIEITEGQLNTFKEYWAFLNEYNQHTNIVSNSDQEVVIKKHFIDSLAIGLLKENIGWNDNKRLIDIGIGGGFPGIPIIIVNPNWKLCAVDSVGKKTKFIKLLTEKLGLKDRIEIINGRAEELAIKTDKREKFDIAVSRAVANLAVLTEYCLPFVKTGGYFIAYKAKDAQKEVSEAKKAISILGGKTENIVSYDLPDVEDIERNLIVISKFKNTPPEYPRKSGIPKKKPLI